MKIELYRWEERRRRWMLREVALEKKRVRRKVWVKADRIRIDRE